MIRNHNVCGQNTGSELAYAGITAKIPIKLVFGIDAFIKWYRDRPVHRDPQGAERLNHHNSRYACQIEKCFKRKLKYIKFSTKKVLIIFFLGAVGAQINNIQEYSKF